MKAFCECSSILHGQAGRLRVVHHVYVCNILQALIGSPAWICGTVGGWNPTAQASKQVQI